MTLRLSGTLTQSADPKRERVRIALIALLGDVPLNMIGDTYPWFIDDRAGTVRDNGGALIAYIDPGALHLVQQLQALGVA